MEVECSSGARETSLALMQDLQQGQLSGSLTAHVDTQEHETLQLAQDEVTDDNPEAPSELALSRVNQSEIGIHVSLLLIGYCGACSYVKLLPLGHIKLIIIFSSLPTSLFSYPHQGF